jgi:hypothetical protein
VSWLISKDWNASFAVEMLGRWYEADRFGETSRDWEALPIATLEYIIPASLFGSDQFANLLGRPAIDLQGSQFESVVHRASHHLKKGRVVAALVP